MGAGLSGEEATVRLLKAPGSVFDDKPRHRTAWIALALTQWKLGVLSEEVKDRAIRAIDDGADLSLWTDEGERQAAKRRRALAQARATLLSDQRAPVRVRPSPVSLSPFRPGDVLRVRSASGREVALWAVRNKTTPMLTQTNVETDFVIAAIGSPTIGPVQEISVATIPLLRGPSAHGVWLVLPQEATGEGWDLLGNVPFPADQAQSLRIGFQAWWVKKPRSKRAAWAWADERVDYWCTEWERQLAAPGAGRVEQRSAVRPHRPSDGGGS
jgi:hypothetical protein